MNNSFKTYSYALGVILAGILWFHPDSHEQQLINVSAKTLPKTVMIEVTVEEPLLSIELAGEEVFRSTEVVTSRYLGSGVFITANGQVLTCAHLFTHGTIKAVIVRDYKGDTWFGEVLNYDQRRDLALVKVNTLGHPYAKLADPRKLKVGQEVIAIGNPLALDFSVTHGIISYLNRDFQFAYNVTQSDTFINPGNSGGPLFDLKGHLIGINSFIIPPVDAPIFTGCGFSIQVGQILEFLAKFKGVERAF